jgi:hypothetical protein
LYKYRDCLRMFHDLIKCSLQSLRHNISWGSLSGCTRTVNENVVVVPVPDPVKLKPPESSLEWPSSIIVYKRKTDLPVPKISLKG